MKGCSNHGFVQEEGPDRVLKLSGYLLGSTTSSGATQSRCRRAPADSLVAPHNSEWRRRCCEAPAVKEACRALTFCTVFFNQTAGISRTHTLLYAIDPFLRCEQKGIIPEAQRGFRRQRSIVNLIFVLSRLQELGRQRRSR